MRAMVELLRTCYQVSIRRASQTLPGPRSTMGTFTANIMRLKKVARLAPSGPDAFMIRVPNGSNWQSPSGRVSPNRWWKKSRPNQDAGYTLNAWPWESQFSPIFGVTSA
jgi:hypothetical protein